jgi:hypothetical protein
MAQESSKPDALLLIATGCTHCPAVLAGLAHLLEHGDLGRLEVINVGAHPEAAAAVNARTVPWCRIGRFELAGVLSLGELKDWTDHATAGSGAGQYLSHLLETQRLPEAIAMVEEDPSLLAHLVLLAGDLETPMAARIGVAAVFEELAGDRRLDDLVDRFGALARAPEPQVRADAAHFLGLTGNPQARPFLEPLLEDEDAEVREVAAESLPLLNRAEA